MTLLELVAYLQENGIVLEWRDDPAATGGGLLWPTFPPGHKMAKAFFEASTIEPYTKWLQALGDAHWQTHTQTVLRKK